MISVHAHSPIAMIAMGSVFRAINRNLMMIYAQTIAVGIAIGKQPALQQTVGRKANARHDVCGCESGLFHILEIVFRIAI